MGGNELWRNKKKGDFRHDGASIEIGWGIIMDRLDLRCWFEMRAMLWIWKIFGIGLYEMRGTARLLFTEIEEVWGWNNVAQEYWLGRCESFEGQILNTMGLNDLTLDYRGRRRKFFLGWTCMIFWTGWVEIICMIFWTGWVEIIYDTDIDLGDVKIVKMEFERPYLEMIWYF